MPLDISPLKPWYVLLHVASYSCSHHDLKMSMELTPRLYCMNSHYTLFGFKTNIGMKVSLDMVKVQFDICNVTH